MPVCPIVYKLVDLQTLYLSNYELVESGVDDAETCPAGIGRGKHALGGLVGSG